MEQTLEFSLKHSKIYPTHGKKRNCVKNTARQCRSRSRRPGPPAPHAQWPRPASSQGEMEKGACASLRVKFKCDS